VGTQPPRDATLPRRTLSPDATSYAQSRCSVKRQDSARGLLFVAEPQGVDLDDNPPRSPAQAAPPPGAQIGPLAIPGLRARARTEARQSTGAAWPGSSLEVSQRACSSGHISSI